MESELLKTFDELGNETGVATREEVHKKGYWHETFHCWFVSQDAGKHYLYFQLRSKLKKDYPNLLDITAAGHLLADETVEDGVREVKEELGIDVSFEELIPLGVLRYSVSKDAMIDKELANGFLYIFDQKMDDFNLQLDEVSGVMKIELACFNELWFGELSEVEANGFVVNETGVKQAVSKKVEKQHFVQHEDTYYKTILQKIGSHISLAGEIEV